MDTHIQGVPAIRYILILEDSTSRRMITLDVSQYTLGRQNENSIILKSRKASRRHATLVRKSNLKTHQFSYWIVDGDLEGKRSHNGIFVNGDKCLIHELKDGDLINFGCDISASYHVIRHLTEADNKKYELPPLPSLPPLVLEEALEEQNTLILSDSHIEKPATLLDDDTFQEQSYLDSVTGLPNKTLLNEYLSIALANSKRNSSILALLLIDIDQFEQITNTYGYSIGDHILQNVGELLNRCVRASDIVARWSGNNFVILLPQLKDIEDGDKIQTRILKKLSDPIEIEKFSIVLSINSSLSLYPQHAQDIAGLLKSLEENLKPQESQVKSAKPNLFPPIHSVDSKSLPSVSSEKLTKIGNRLQIALDHNELSLAYQPQVNVTRNTIEVMEALLRWKHPQKGFISPKQFFPWLEQTNLVIPITQWILETVCSQNQQWQNLGMIHLPVSVNISIRQFQHPHFVPVVAESLAKTGVDPHWLELEVTEETILNNLDQSREVLKELQQLGIYLSLDDFGQGLVSIGCLQNLPFHKLKIEQSCVHKLTENPEDTAMISTLINIGKVFNLQVVAEGVETQQQVEILRNLGCEEMQGYRFCQPLNAEQATQFLQFHSQSKTHS